jgi:hypothetical protein
MRWGKVIRQSSSKFSAYKFLPQVDEAVHYTPFGATALDGRLVVYPPALLEHC